MVSVKKTAWQIWKIMPEITEVFKLCWKEDSMEINPKFGRFIILLYCKISDVSDINPALCKLLASGRYIDHIPPTREALFQHIKRATLQTKLWKLCCIKTQKSLVL